MSAPIEYQRLCHICQDYVDHFTRNCPTLICAECDEKGHAKRNCPYLVEPKKVCKENQFPDSEKQNEISESAKVQTSDDKYPDLQCAECEESGHEITDCPYLKNS